MNTTEFFDLILAREGHICLAIPREEGGFRHLWFDTTTAAANAVGQLDARGVTVYHACATFASKANRLQTNVAKLGSLWLDVDVGDSDKKYPTFKKAARAILSFAWDAGLPQPYIIKSGTGAHAYWPLTADVDPDPWRITATMLKAACAIWGLKADPSRTSDHASILRPVGSTHRKAAPTPVEVAVEGKVSEFEALSATLQTYLEANGGVIPASNELTLPGTRPDIFGTPSNDDLMAGIHYAERTAEAVANQCGVVGMVRDSRGNVDQPTWYHVLGAIAFCEDGDIKAHEWSAGHPQYSDRETNAKLAQIRAKQTGPTTCAKLAEFQPDMCKVCPHQGRIKTPAVLGSQPDQLVMVTQSAPADPAMVGMPAQRRTPPAGFRFAIDEITGKEVIQYSAEAITNDEGDVVEYIYQTFCRTIFYPVSRLLMSGEAVVEFERILPQTGEVRRFTLPGSSIGKGKDACSSVLGMNEIVSEGSQGPAKMDAMLRRWMHDLTEQAAQIQSHQGFGWVDGERAFVLGDRVLRPGGVTSRGILTGAAKQLTHAFTPKGDAGVWVDTINRAYNAPGQEGYQFLVLLGFAAPLMHMNAEINGVTVYAHSEGSGVGKTTATRAALSAWGHWDDLQLAEGKATEGSLWALMGCYRSVPVVFDELTNMDPKTASQLVFSVSSGRAKQRLKSDGELRQNNSNWRTIMLASGNNLLSEKLSQHRANAEAEISRLFEFTLEATPHLTPNQALDLFPKLLDNYGHAGEMFIRYVLDHYDVIHAKVRAVREALNSEIGITQKERYWSSLLASTLVALLVCRKVGLLGFDVAPLKAWMQARLTENRIVRVETATQPLDLLGKMLADLWQGVLVTTGEGDMRTGQPAGVVVEPRGVLHGRAILTQDKKQQTVLMVNENSVRDWCVKKGVSAAEMFRAAVNAGWAGPAKERYSLGRGTIAYSATSSYVGCWKLYPDLMGSAAPGLDTRKFVSMPGGLANASGSSNP